jgi:NADH:ubiquinone oxidoreductase subunit 6 (subunit J)
MSSQPAQPQAREGPGQRPQPRLFDELKWIVAAAIFATLLFSLIAYSGPSIFQGGAPQLRYEAWGQAPATGENPHAVSDFMFGAYAFPLEVLSLVLLVALVGAVVLAKPERTEEEGP